jgi:uncharacterized delta-60 repeat protein
VKKVGLRLRLLLAALLAVGVGSVLVVACGSTGAGPEEADRCDGAGCDGGGPDTTTDGASTPDASRIDGKSGFDAAVTDGDPGFDASVGPDPCLGDGGPAGSLDLTFADGGMLWFPFANPALGYDVIHQPDGKILLCGQSEYGLTVIRLLVNGSVDPSFGDGGVAGAPIKGAAWALALAPDGKIVAAGYAFVNAITKVDYSVTRFLPNGAVDTTFGDGGSVTTDLGSISDQGRSVALLPDGKILVSGVTELDWGLVRYESDGRLDPTFGTGGKVVTDVRSDDRIGSMDLGPGETILVAGMSMNPVTGLYSPSIARYQKDGLLDPALNEAAPRRLSCCARAS